MRHLVLLLLLAPLLLGGCAFGLRPGGTLSFDTETVSRIRHAAVVQGTSQATATATVRAVASAFARNAPAILRLFQNEEEVKQIEAVLVACARQADREIKSERLGGRSPEPGECRAQVAVDRCGNPITLAMELGNLKHARVAACARDVLKELWPATFSIEQRYRFYRSVKLLERVSAEEEKRLLENNCTGELWRTIKPDLVLHADNDFLRALLIIDYKFPCPDTNPPAWAPYDETSAYSGSNQRDIYKEALGGEALIITPMGVY